MVTLLLQISDHLRQKTQSWVFSKRLRGFSTCEKTHSLSSREQKQMKTRHLPKHSHVFVANSFSSINCVTLLESRKPFESFRKDSTCLKWSEICSTTNFRSIEKKTLKSGPNSKVFRAWISSFRHQEHDEKHAIANLCRKCHSRQNLKFVLRRSEICSK